MKRHSALRSILSVSALALSAGGMMAATAQQTHAQSPSVLQPRGGWSVTKMDQPSNGAGSYCALARQYDKDIIFTLGRNTTDEYSLAVDFQKDQMDPDKAYKLTLSPGAGQVRAFDLMPLSARAMVIRLGWDDSFFKALDSSRALRVGIGDVDYSFNMPDIAAGQKDLQACVEGLKAAAKPQQMAEADTDAAATKTDILNAEAGAKTGFSARKGKDDGEARTAAPAAKEMSPPPAGMKDTGMELEMAEAVPAPAVKSMPVMASSGASSNAAEDIATLRAANERLARALEKQKAQLQESYSNTPDANSLAEMEEKIRLLEKENERLSKGGAAGTVTQQAEASPTVAPASSDQLKALQQQIKDLNTKNTQLEKQLADAKNIIPSAPNAPAGGKTDPGELQKMLIASQAEKAKLQEELETLRRSVEDERVAGAGGDEQMEKAVRRYNEAEREIKRLGTLLEQERSARQPGDTDGSKQASRVALLEKELDKVKTEQSSIAAGYEAEKQKALKDLAAAQQEMKGLQNKNADLSTELQQVKTALASLKQAEAQDVANPAEIKKIEDKLAAAEKERKALSDQNAMYKTELDKANAALLQAKVQTGGNDQMAADLKKAQQESRDYQLKLSALEEEMKKLQATVAMNAYRPETEEARLNGAAPAAGYEPPPLQPAVPSAKPVQQQGGLFSQNDVQGLLSRAGLSPQGGIKKAGSGTYSWNAPGGMKGSATVESSGAGFARLVDQHINALKGQCKGDFAAIPSSQGTNSANFEVACVSGAGGTSSSIAFFEQKGSFVSVAVETAAENMEMAMDARDKIARVR